MQKDAVSFSLESYGRYFGDNYYVGTLLDPKTGKKMTDRELERQLTAVGNAPHSSRQADLLMRAFPIVRDKKELSTRQQLAYLNKVLLVYPMCDAAWLELAALHRDGKLTDAQEATRLVNKALSTFARFPDFSWKLVDELLTPQKDKSYRTQLRSGKPRTSAAPISRGRSNSWTTRRMRRTTRAPNGLANTVRGSRRRAATCRGSGDADAEG